VDSNCLADAAAVLESEYPFKRLANVGRRYSAHQCMEIFVRDGFIDRYSGDRLIFPGTLRLLSLLLPLEFPFHTNWKTDACHFAFYELFPTVDHVTPVSRGGADQEDNWVSTSMLRNAAKANFTLQELGWKLLPAGNISAWDGLTGWFLKQAAARSEIQSNAYLRRWLDASKAVLSG
jgi:hypothetical protein